MSKKLSIHIEFDRLVFKGSIEDSIPIDEDTVGIDISFPAQGFIILKRNYNYNRLESKKEKTLWRFTNFQFYPEHSFKIKDHTAESDIITVMSNPAIIGGVVSFDGALDGPGRKQVGIEWLTPEKENNYKGLLNYLGKKGFLCVDDVKKDLRAILNNTYKG